MPPKLICEFSSQSNLHIAYLDFILCKRDDFNSMTRHGFLTCMITESLKYNILERNEGKLSHVKLLKLKHCI